MKYHPAMPSRTPPSADPLRLMAAAEGALAARHHPATAVQPQIKANQEITGAWNRLLVLALLLRSGPLSRRQLAQLTGLRDSTLTYIIRDLQHHRIVREAGTLARTGAGRRHHLLAISGGVGHVLGISLQRHSARMVLHNLAGREIARRSMSFERRPLQDILPALRSSYTEWLPQLSNPPGRLLGVGLGVSGVVDVSRGTLLLSRMFGARDIPLAAQLHEQFGVEVHVDHDANFAALAEVRSGVAREAPNFLYLLIALDAAEQAVQPAVGAALVIDRLVYRGVNFAAGEIEDSLLPTPSRQVQLRGMTSLSEAQPRLSAALGRWTDSLAEMLARLANFIDPGCIVLGGDLHPENRAFLSRVQGRFDANLLPIGESRRIPVCASTLGSSSVAIGGAYAALEHTLLCGRMLSL